MRSSGPLPPAVLLLAVVLIFVVHFVMPSLDLWSWPASTVGLVPLATGIYTNLAADRLLKRHRTTVKPFQTSAVLVTSGVYGRTRHPMYLGFVLILLGLALLLGSVAPFLIVAAFAALMEAHYVRAEEAMLHDRFGEEWSSYAARVGKWM